MSSAWSRQEVEATVRDYFDMLALELRGEQYNKAAHNRGLRARLDDRSPGAVERKHQNISAGEVRFSEANADAYRLYRLFEFRQSPGLFQLHGDVGSHVHLQAINYRARF